MQFPDFGSIRVDSASLRAGNRFDGRDCRIGSLNLQQRKLARHFVCAGVNADLEQC
jgi:hypothetical protein